MKKFFSTPILYAILAGGLSSAALASPEPNPTDQADFPARIVSLGGPVTETVYALGLGDRVVAVDLSSTWPAEAAARPKVGYIRALSAEGVISMRPDLVIGTEDAGPPAVLELLRAAKTSLVLVPADQSVEGARAKIRAVAKALNHEQQGEELVATLDRDLKKAKSLRDAQGRGTVSKSTPKVLFVYARGQGTLSVSGYGTAADAMIALAGGKNAVTGYAGYKPLTPEALASAAPDVILLTSAGLASIGGTDGLLTQPGVAMTPAGRARRIIAIDDELLLGFGPRLGIGVRDLTLAIHPEHR